MQASLLALIVDEWVARASYTLQRGKELVAGRRQVTSSNPGRFQFRVP